jgi:hypothetical protein
VDLAAVLGVNLAGVAVADVTVGVDLAGVAVRVAAADLAMDVILVGGAGARAEWTLVTEKALVDAYVGFVAGNI